MRGATEMEMFFKDILAIVICVSVCAAVTLLKKKIIKFLRRPRP